LSDIALAQLEGVDFGREGEPVLSNISLSIRPGSFTAVIGPSGCGKTTLLRLLAVLEKPSRGTVNVATNKIGYVFQQPALMPWANVLDNVVKPLVVSGTAKAIARKKALVRLEQVGMADAAEKFPHQLSGGMAQRVSLARALVTEPELLLMDEPFGALDALTRETMNDELLNLWRQANPAIVFVTHAIDEAVYLAEEIVVMSPLPGRVVEVLPGGAGQLKRDAADFVEVCGSVRGMLG